MKLSKEIAAKIDERMRECEEHYQIKVLYCAVRGSIPIGIYRKNSDLDLSFVFKNKSSKKCSAIHDIIDYGFDFWGWDINDVIKTIEENNNLYYSCDSRRFHNYVISGEHARGGLTYYDAFTGISNELVRDYKYLTMTEEIYKKIHNNCVTANFFIDKVTGTIQNLLFFHELSNYEYLYTSWYILFIKHMLRGGLPGVPTLNELLKLYEKEELCLILDDLCSDYKSSISKHSRMVCIKELNAFLLTEYEALKKELNLFAPKYDRNYMELNLNQLKEIVMEF